MHLAVNRENLAQLFSDFPDNATRTARAALGSRFLPTPGKRAPRPAPAWRPAGTPPPPPPRACAHVTRPSRQRRRGGASASRGSSRPFDGAGRRGAWRARGPALPLAAAGPCGGPRERPARGPGRAGAGAQRGRSEGGGGTGAKAEEGVPGNGPHMPGVVPRSWRRVGPRGGPPPSPGDRAADRKTLQEGASWPRARPLEGRATPGPSEPGRGAGQRHRRALRLAKTCLPGPCPPGSGSVTAGRPLSPRLRLPSF